MKRIIFVLFILFGISIQMFATTWDEGIALMESKKYSEAKKYFESKEELEMNLEYYSHLAWINYQLQEYEEAKLCLLTAQKLYGPNRWLLEALEKVNNNLGLSHIEHKQSWGLTTKNGSLFSMNSLFYVILTLSLAIAFMRFVYKGKRNVRLFVQIGLLTIISATFLQLIWQQYQFNKLPDGILIENQTWDLRKENEVFWPKALSVRIMQVKNNSLIIKNTLGEEIEVPRNALKTL